MEELDNQILSTELQVHKGSLRSHDAVNSLKSLGTSVEITTAILDHIWLSGMESSSESRQRLQHLANILVQEDLVSISDLICSLDPELVPTEIQTEQVIRRKRTQAKTKKVYNITKFNTSSECPEGYAVYTDLVWGLSAFGTSDLPGVIDQCKRAIGRFSLCPNRCLSLTLNMLSIDPRNTGYIVGLIGAIFPQPRVQSVVLFHCLSLGKSEDGSSMISGPSDMAASRSVESATGCSPSWFFQDLVVLVKSNLLDLQELWPILTPSVGFMETSADEILSEYETQIENVSKLLGGSMVSPDQETEASPDAYLEGVLSKFASTMEKSQKVLLLVELMNQDLFEHAVPFLEELQTSFGKIPIGCIPSISRGFARWTQKTLQSPPDWETVRKILRFWGVYLGSEPVALASIYRAMKESETSVVLSLIGEFCLPTQSAMSPNPFLDSLVWEILKQVSPGERFSVYQTWQQQYDSCVMFPLKLVQSMVQAEVRSLLKRVVKGAQIGDTASRNSHYQFAKLAANHSVLVLQYVLGQIQVHFNYNLIEPYVEVTGKIGLLAQDVCGYLIGVELMRPDRTGLSMKTACVQPWLNHLSEFSGKFLKKHPESLSCLSSLLLIAKKLMETKQNTTLGSTPARVLLESILEHMGNFEVVDQLNAAQLESIAGGPVLSSISQQASVTMSVSPRTALKTAFCTNAGLVFSLWSSLQNELFELRTSQKIAQELMVGGGVKLLGILNDSIHKVWLQLTEFLAQVCSKEEYAGFLAGKSIEKIGWDLPMTMHVLRPIEDSSSLPPGGALAESFWTLALYDIYVPEDSYQRQIGSFVEQVGAQEMLAEKVPSTPEMKDQVRAAKKELVRLKEVLTKLETEFKTHQARHSQVSKKIRDAKDEFFQPTTVNLVEDFFAKRILISVQDSLFCVHFAKMLVREKVTGFDCIEFFNAWTKLLPTLLACSSEGETKLFAYFVAQLMTWVKDLRDPKKFAQVVKDNPVFGSVKDLAHFKELHASWEANILESIKEILSQDADWCEKRNCLVLVSKTCDVFPIIHQNATELKSIIEALTSDSQEDIATLSLSLSRKIASMEPNWVDKPTMVIESAKPTPSPVLEDQGKSARSSTRTESKPDPSPKVNTSKRTAMPAEEQNSKRSRDDRSDRDRSTRLREPLRNREAPISRRR